MPGYQDITCTFGSTVIAGKAVWSDPEPTVISVTLDGPTPVVAQLETIELRDDERNVVYVARPHRNLTMDSAGTRFLATVIETRPA